MTSRRIIKIENTYDPDTGDSSQEVVDEFEVDYLDEEDEENFADAGTRILNDEGVLEASSTAFHSGIWYETEDQQDYNTGEYTRYSYHLRGFTVDEEEIIFRRLMRIWKTPPKPPTPRTPPKTEAERMMDFFFPKPKKPNGNGSLLSLKSWGRK